MGLLVFMRNLLLALCLFLVLGFLYYSAWKLHLLRWEDSNSVVLSFDSVGHTVGSAFLVEQEGEKEKLWLLCFRCPSHLTLLQTQEKTEPRKNPKKQWQLQAQPFLVEYDKLGFLLNLDSKLFSKPAPMFLDDSFRKWARIRDFVPPFGIKGQDNLIKAILSATKDYRLTPALDRENEEWVLISLQTLCGNKAVKRGCWNSSVWWNWFFCLTCSSSCSPVCSMTDCPPRSRCLHAVVCHLSCRRCIIVGNGGVLANKSLGLKIDDYDVVVRLNSAPVKGFEKDVGGKTTLRITYPEGAIQKMEQYEKDSLFVLAGFKWQDFKWLKYIVYKEKVSASDGFWKSVATRVPREPHDIRILNPYFIQEAAFSFIGLPFNNGLMGRGNIPTLGSVAITMALHNCDEVAVAGFGYDMSSPNAPLHYYENIKMSAIKESWTHNIQREKEFLRKLVKARVITDLTSGI
ncbi:CMP-N-acetylneuraminate-beta-1,4-galactoside alpha-2,3-sialyltransferase isoform X3 [Heliangelus exortis]|uniref:CMP-N-acetylneuraminate-beta-1,4-galactoside alpha-2,3-sialyltransferase isoform X3 n=1 Tax=Heliangelus exortis TaxID=472823 RepID=UPI003A905834